MKRMWTMVGVILMLVTRVQAEPLFPQGSPPASVIDEVDLMAAPLDDILAATTLQGHVNGGDRSLLYLRVRPSDDLWLRRLKEKGHVSESKLLTLDDCFRKYAKCYSKVVVYDPAVSATLNVATMMASLEPAIVVAPGDAERRAVGRPVDDLRGRWKTNVEAYRWAFKELWPRMNHSILATYHPTCTHHFIRDYFVRAKVFQFWVTGKESQDGIVSNYDEERTFAEEVLAAAPANIPIIGWWGGGADQGLTEYGGVGLAGEYGKITVGCDWEPNLSMMTAVPADLDHAVSAYQERRQKRIAPELERDKVYIAFDFVESGDSPPYMQDIEPTVWADPKRGKMSINWCMGLPLLDMLPFVAEYYFEQATPNDHLYAAISGAGYVHPYRAFMSKTPDPEATWKRYLQLTANGMKRAGFHELGLYTGAWVPFDRKVNDATTMRFVNGLPGLDMLVMGMGRDEGMDGTTGNYTLGTKPVLVSHLLTRWDPAYDKKTTQENIDTLVKDIRDHTPAHRPAFMQVMALSWAFRPTQVDEVRNALGEAYVPVTLPEFSLLRREAQPRD